MSTGTAIEWTEATWNPVTGCDRVSEGCDHCYAQTLAKRLKAMGNPRYQVDGDPRTSGPGFGVQMHADKLGEPLGWKSSKMVFVNSMSDLFHDDVDSEFIAEIFARMAVARRHTFQVLTKRPGRMASLMRDESFRARVDEAANPFTHAGYVGPWPLSNVWLGTSVENQKWADVRIPKLLESPAAVHFLSCEPLLGEVDIRTWLPWPGQANEIHASVDWVIVGGESGHGFRPMDPEWALSLRDQCEEADVAFFFKQWGGHTPKAGGRELHGRTWNQMPTDRDGPVRERVPSASVQ